MDTKLFMMGFWETILIIGPPKFNRIGAAENYEIILYYIEEKSDLLENE